MGVWVSWRAGGFGRWRLGFGGGALADALHGEGHQAALLHLDCSPLSTSDSEAVLAPVDLGRRQAGCLAGRRLAVMAGADDGLAQAGWIDATLKVPLLARRAGVAGKVCQA